jgi:opine dehydrogenase
VPIGLTIYSQLGRQLGVDLPLMESVIHLSGALLGRDFATEGRTLERCGIEGLSGNQLLAFADSGRRD